MLLISAVVCCQEFYNCGCIDGGRATLGVCPRHCQTVFYVYVSLQFITFVLSSITVVPLMTSLVRSVVRLYHHHVQYAIYVKIFFVTRCHRNLTTPKLQITLGERWKISLKLNPKKCKNNFRPNIG